MTERLTVTATEAAQMLGVSRHCIYDLVHRGHIRVVPHMGRRVLIPRTEIDRLVADPQEASA